MTIPPLLIEIRPSVILLGEIGVFATRALAVGTIIAEDAMFCEQYHPWSDAENLDEQTKRFIDKYCVGTPDGFWCPPDPNYIPINYQMNHSCVPNIGFDEQGNFVIITDVQCNEELCWDYGFAETNPAFRMECRCGYSICRNVITGNDWRETQFVAINYRYMMPELRQRIDMLCLK